MMSRDSIDDGLSIQGSCGGRFAPEPDIADATGTGPSVQGPQKDRSRPIADAGGAGRWRVACGLKAAVGDVSLSVDRLARSAGN
jgi:hypothetical protein